MSVVFEEPLRINAAVVDFNIRKENGVSPVSELRKQELIKNLRSLMQVSQNDERRALKTSSEFKIRDPTKNWN